MLTVQSLNPHNYPLDDELTTNLQDLADKMNQLAEKWNNPMIITSGLRSNAQQQALIAEGKSNAVHSRHLTGQAVDILDNTGNLWKWTMININLLVAIGLWLEDKKSTPTWVHFQSVPPNSGKRIFIP